MALLTKDQILNSEDRPTERVEVPEWGGEVIVGTMTGLERDRLEGRMLALQDGRGQLRSTDGVRSLIVALTCVDENGERLFSEVDAVALGKKSCRALERVSEVAMRLSGITPKDVEEMAGNSPDGQSGGSG